MGKIKISKILIVGSGSIAAKHHSIAKSIYPCADVRVYSESGNKLKDGRMLSTFKEVVEFSPQISVLANMTSKHLNIGIALAKLGSHLLIEKPLSDNLYGVTELLEIEKDLNLKIQVGYNLKYLPTFKLFSKLVRSEEVGRVLDIHIQVGKDLQTWRPNQDYRKSVTAKKINGGGVLRELSHEIDYFIEVFGYPTWVFASTARVGDLEVDVEDIAHIVIGLKGNDKREVMATLHLDFIRQDAVRKCTVIGSRATLEWDVLSGRIEVKDASSMPGTVYKMNSESIQDTYFEEWTDFIQSITDNKKPANNLISSIHTMEIILACEKSQETSRRVYLSNEQKEVHV